MVRDGGSRSGGGCHRGRVVSHRAPRNRGGGIAARIRARGRHHRAYAGGAVGTDARRRRYPRLRECQLFAGRGTARRVRTARGDGFPRWGDGDRRGASCGEAGCPERHRACLVRRNQGGAPPVPCTPGAGRRGDTTPRRGGDSLPPPRVAPGHPFGVYRDGGGNADPDAPAVFAVGILRAAAYVRGRAPGLYTMSDLLYM